MLNFRTPSSPVRERDIGMLSRAFKGAHTLFTGQRERERGSEKWRERERGRETERVREREKDIEYDFNYPELLFLKGMTGALAPLSYLVI